MDKNIKDEVGMLKEEVISIFGKPNKTFKDETNITFSS